VRIDDEADGARRDAGLAADAGGEGHLVIGLERHAGLGEIAAARDADIVAAQRLERAAIDHRLVDGEAALDPFAGADADAERLLRRPCRAQRGRDLEWEAHAVLEAAAI